MGSKPDSFTGLGAGPEIYVSCVLQVFDISPSGKPVQHTYSDE
jgi:hypothetical protein